MSKGEADIAGEGPSPMPLSEFLERVPPSQTVLLDDHFLVLWSTPGDTGRCLIDFPEIQLHCPNDKCNGLRFFRLKGSDRIVLRHEWKLFFVDYICSNCQTFSRVFALAAQRVGHGTAGECYKFGELPPYGPPTPARLISMVGEDRETFLKGRRSENQGLGIGAFGYYRRVVEDQKNRILSEILRVSEKIGAPVTALDTLKRAMKETQFVKAMEMVKDVIPPALLINGHNPMTLLHSALSRGLHAKTDQECLEMATSIRVVLAELSERLGQALKDERELTEAIGKLIRT